MAGDKTRNNGTWTESQFKTKIIASLRQLSRWWEPKKNCLKNARTRRGYYLCASCNKEVPSTIKGVYKTGKKAGKPRKIKNIIADHVEPVVDPHKGFVDWNTYIERMFIEEGWQAICYECHQIKTKEEREIRVKRNESN